MNRTSRFQIPKFSNTTALAPTLFIGIGIAIVFGDLRKSSHSTSRLISPRWRSLKGLTIRRSPFPRFRAPKRPRKLAEWPGYKLYIYILLPSWKLRYPHPGYV